MEVQAKLNPGDAALSVRFYRKPKQNQQRSIEEGRPCFDNVDYVEIYTAGDKTSVIDRPATQEDKIRFSKKYEAHLKNQDQEVLDGTPLSEWSGVSQSQVLELAHFHCKTVEQLAAMSDATIKQIGGGYGERRKAARAYLEAAAGAAPVEKMVAELAQRDDMIKNQSLQMESMAAAIKQLEAKVGAEVPDSQEQGEQPAQTRGRKKGR